MRKDREPAPEREHIPCAHETCDHPAMVRVQTKTGWAKLCMAHYVRHHDEIARKRFTELGLDRRSDETREQWRKRVMGHLRGALRVKTFADAERAEDDWAKAS